MDIQVGNGHNAEVVVYPVFAQTSLDRVPYTLRPHMKKLGEATWFFDQNNEQHTLIVGLGEKSDFSLETLRAAAGHAGRAVEKERFNTVSVQLTDLTREQFAEKDVVAAWVEGWMLGTYAFDTYLTDKGDRSLSQMWIASGDRRLEEAVHIGRVRAQGTMYARDLCNEPPNVLRPQSLAEAIVHRFRGTDVTVKVYEGEDLVANEMNGLITVGRGSEHPPAFVEARYCTDADQPLIALVGKGMTFDTGGISLKKGRNISDMRMDMGGAAAVVGSLDILTKLNARVNVVALIPTAENTLDGGAMLPGEVIRYANGTSVQVGNTDAEGRLILADALLRAKALGAKTVVDIATLTGACAQALGPEMAGIWGSESLLRVLQEIGEQSGDRVWPMPLIEEYAELIKSDYADVMNISSVAYGGAITAALFLKTFVDPAMDWAHIDMAGPMERGKTKGYHTKGASGFGARLLADFVITCSRKK